MNISEATIHFEKDSSLVVLVCSDVQISATYDKLLMPVDLIASLNRLHGFILIRVIPCALNNILDGDRHVVC